MASMQEQATSLLKTEFATVPFSEVLRKPVTALLGISTGVASSLKLLDIFTVFDLATSEVFAGANKILDAGNNTKSLLYQYGSASADLVRESVAGRVRIDKLRDSSIAALQRVPNDSAAGISQALGIANIRELALYPPYRAAVKILNMVYFPENDAAVDPDQPADLLPKSGEYPTEKVQYTTLVMDEIIPGSEGTDITSSEFQPLDLANLEVKDGFQTIAYGALITMTQSFYAKGVTLGNLLHSVSLAPGESTRIAVVDWTRKSRAGQTEVVEEEDELDNQTSHNRALNEVTAATARDAQNGFSQSYQSASTNAAAAAVSASASYLGVASIDVSGGYNTSNSSAAADSYSTSSGSRDLSSQMIQNINDRTHQNAHSARSRRAAVIKEVSQSEHEAISTRVLANYNHMHALTIQYYEVVQVYRTRVSISKIDKVIFIPVKLVNFDDDNMVQRYSNVLGMASPTREIREAIQNHDSIELAPAQDTIFSRLSDQAVLASVRERPWAFDPRAIRRSVPATGLHTMMSRDGPLLHSDNNEAEALSSGSQNPTAATVPPAVGPNVMRRLNFRDVLWNDGDQIMHAARRFSFQTFRKDSESVFLPNDVSIDGINIDGEGATITPIFGMASGGTRNSVSPDQRISLSELSYIAVRGSLPDKAINVRVQIQALRNGLRAPISLPDVTVKGGSGHDTIIVNIKTGKIKPEIKKFLMANQSFYSLAVFRSLTPTQIALMLARYTIKIKEERRGSTPESPVTIVEKSLPVSQVVEPRPVRYVGNYLAFKMNTESDPDWAVWLENRGLKVGYATEDIVPLASGGSFAEAVLGRYNCAEKLDMTRFWNWQDSPTPLLPSDVSAIQAGYHNTSDGSNVNPGQLSQPIINMALPAQLPDPVGTAAVLSAIQRGNIFRDMSGLQGTQQLAQTGTVTTGQAATSAGQQASVNMQAMMSANTERQRIQAQKEVAMAQLAFGMPSSSMGGLNHSQDGAKINYFDTQHKTGAILAGAEAGAMPGAMPGAMLGESATATGDYGRASSSGTGSAREGGGLSVGRFSGSTSNPAFNSAVWGDGVPRSAIIRDAMDLSGGEGGGRSMFHNVAYPGNQELVKFWSDLLDFQVPDAVVQALAARDIKVQKYEDAMGDLNVDLYQVHITKMPTLPGGTGPATAEEFLFYVRTQINDFVNKEISSFYPLDNSQDKAKWESKSPVGAVIRIDIPLIRVPDFDTWFGHINSLAVGNNAAVVCSASDATHWRFTTVRTPFRQTDSHPVTGVREFGIKTLPNNATPTGQPGGAVATNGYTFYTRGADRTTGLAETIFQNDAFAGGKKLWLSLRAGMKKWIEDHHGEAEEVIPEYQKVVTWPGSYWDSFHKYRSRYDIPPYMKV